jgi:hypothetical protein
MFIRGLPLPKECVIGFPDGAAVSQSGLLEKAMSMFSRESSLSVTAVSRASSVCCRSLVSPGHMVLTFQVAKRIAGVFLFLQLVFPGAEFCGPLVEMVL